MFFFFGLRLKLLKFCGCESLEKDCFFFCENFIFFVKGKIVDFFLEKVLNLRFKMILLKFFIL